MISVNGVNQLSVSEQLETIRETLQVSKVMGFTVCSVVVQHYVNDLPQFPVLCLFTDYLNCRVKMENGLPLFPLFYDHFVCEELMKHEYMTIKHEDRQQDVARIWVAFSSKWTG
jgi:hypothetical protein